MHPFPTARLVRGIFGGIAGGLLGGLACKLLAGQGLYAVAIPGGLVGIGFLLAARHRHIVFGFVSGLLGLLAGLLTQWQVYSNEPSFFNLVIDLKDYHSATWIMIGLGTIMAFVIGLGSPSNASGVRPPSQHSNS